MDFSQLRINANRIYKLFVSNSDSITESERERINTLTKKYREKGKLTENEFERLEFLREKEINSNIHSFGAGAQKYLFYIYCLKKYGKPPFLLGDGIGMDPSAANGILKEKKIIELIESNTGIILHRNKQTFKNDYIKGVPDAFDDEDYTKSLMVHEFKSTNDIIKFQFKKRYPITLHDYLQTQSYMDICNKKKAALHFCLVDYPDMVIKEQRELFIKKYVKDGEDTLLLEDKWASTEGLLRHKNINDKERIFTCFIDRSDAVIQKINHRIDESREWLNEFAIFDAEIKETGTCEPQRNSFLKLLRRLGLE